MEERPMANARKRARQRRRAKSLIGSMREFLTPEVFKQVRNASKRRKSPRWDLHPLLYILVLTTYCCGDSLPEKFEIARTFYVASCPKRKRLGKRFSGFEKAVCKLPLPVLRTLAAAIRSRIESVFGDRWKVGGFIPLGCDGTRQACPRTEELEKRLGTFGKEGSSPMIWNTSIVHLTLGFPFCWRLGKGGKASERSHLLHMLRWLPASALIVADAGYVGYDVVATMIAKTRWPCLRRSTAACRRCAVPEVYCWKYAVISPAGRSLASRLRKEFLMRNGSVAHEPAQSKSENGLAARTTSHPIRLGS
jgi:hypothetical protein